MLLPIVISFFVCGNVIEHWENIEKLMMTLPVTANGTIFSYTLSITGTFNHMFSLVSISLVFGNFVARAIKCMSLRIA